MKKFLLFTLFLIIFISCREEPKEDINSVTIFEEKKDSCEKIKVYNSKVLPYLETFYHKLMGGELISYNWRNEASCNVGILAQIVCNYNEKEVDESLRKLKDYKKYADKLEKTINYTSGSWANRFSFYCGATNKRGPEIIGELQDAGFTSGDISSLEYLNDPYLVCKSQIKSDDGQHYSKSENLIKYLKAWIDTIKKQENIRT